MKNNTIITVLVIVVVGIVGFMIMPSLGSQNIANNTSDGEYIASAVVHKTPACGCCGVYASYLGKRNFDVEISDVEDLRPIKESLGVPYELESCHTTEVGGYVVEGHIPTEAIENLLSEKPDIKGIGMAGMPSGSPGMPGPKNGDFVIYEITHDGERGDVFMTI